jgi:hypothetical protein
MSINGLHAIRKTPLMSRRRVMGLAAVGAALLAGRRLGWANPLTDAITLEPVWFDVLAQGSVIGHHRVNFESDGETLRAITAMQMVFTVLGLTLFEYVLDAVETWQNGRLVAFSSKTNDNGHHLKVEGKANGDKFEVTGKKGTAIAPADIMVASYWTQEIITRDMVINPKNGTLKKQAILNQSPDQVTVAGKTVPVIRYRITSVLSGDIYYDERGRWLGADFSQKGVPIQYRLRT